MSKLYTQFSTTFFEKTRLSLLTIIYKEEKVSFNQLKDRLQGTDGAVTEFIILIEIIIYIFHSSQYRVLLYVNRKPKCLAKIF